MADDAKLDYALLATYEPRSCTTSLAIGSRSPAHLHAACPHSVDCQDIRRSHQHSPNSCKLCCGGAAGIWSLGGILPGRFFVRAPTASWHAASDATHNGSSTLGRSLCSQGVTSRSQCTRRPLLTATSMASLGRAHIYTSMHVRCVLPLTTIMAAGISRQMEGSSGEMCVARVCSCHPLGAEDSSRLPPSRATSSARRDG